jgi:hypothetical protein
MSHRQMIIHMTFCSIFRHFEFTVSLGERDPMQPCLTGHPKRPFFPHAVFSCGTDTDVLLHKLYILFETHMLCNVASSISAHVVNSSLICLACYDISCIRDILYRNIFKSRLRICWTNCWSHVSSVAPFLVNPPVLCRIATWDCSVLWRMNASHLKMFPFLYTAVLHKFLWQRKYIASCRYAVNYEECPKSFLCTSCNVCWTNKSTTLVFYSKSMVTMVSHFV